VEHSLGRAYSLVAIIEPLGIALRYLAAWVLFPLVKKGE
jgi:hypothetical protein